MSIFGIHIDSKLQGKYGTTKFFTETPRGTPSNTVCNTGLWYQLWMSMKKIEMAASVNRRPHPSSKTPDAIAALNKQEKYKYAKNQCRLMQWE